MLVYSVISLSSEMFLLLVLPLLDVRKEEDSSRDSTDWDMFTLSSDWFTIIYSVLPSFRE